MLKTIKIERQNVAYKYLNICYMVICKKSLSTFAPIHYLMAVKLFLFRARVSDIFACKHKYTQLFESLLYSYTDSWNPIYSPYYWQTQVYIDTIYSNSKCSHIAARYKVISPGNRKEVSTNAKDSPFTFQSLINP